MTEILLRRGTEANIPALENGEPGWVTDTKTLYVGDGGSSPIPIGGGKLLVTPQMFGAKGDGSTDDTTAILAAIGYVAPYGGKVVFPIGSYKTTAPIVQKSGVSLIGDGAWRGLSATREGVSEIYAVHNGASIVSMKGAIGCGISDINLTGDATVYPKVGLELGRSSSVSAGWHYIKRVGIFGSLSVAGIYSIASEDNLWIDPYVYLTGGAAKYNFFTSVDDSLSVDSLTSGSNLDNTFIHPFFINSSSDSDAANIYIECAELSGNEVPVGSLTFIGGYLTAYAGAYIHIHNNSATPYGAHGPFTFQGVSGEEMAAGDPTWGIRLTTVNPVELRGLSVTGARLSLGANSPHEVIHQDSDITLINPNIVIQRPRNAPYAIGDLHRDKVKGGIVDVGESAAWTAATLSAGWSNPYGTYPVAGYSIDATGRISCRGTVLGGTGTIFTLPVGYRPPYIMTFPTHANGAIGRLQVATTGEVTLLLGTAVDVDLSPIQFSSPNY